jgi:hypothetical protein
MASRKNGHFVGAIEDFKTKTFTGGGERVLVEPTGLYATWDWKKVFLHYTGDKAQAAGVLLELPNDPDTLRAIGMGFLSLATKLEAE